MNRFTKHLVLLALLCAYFAQGMANVRHASLTFDEGPHLAVGYTTLRTGDFRLQPVHIHPPLANVIAAAPLLLQNDLPDPTAIDGWGANSLSAITDILIWKYPHPASIATAGRVPVLLLGVLLAALLTRWARMTGGPLAGFIALTLYAFDPNIIAHSSLITTDITVTLLTTATLFSINVFLFPHKGSHRQPAYLILTGLLLGLALLSKVSALLLLPAIGLFIGLRELSLRRTILSSLFYTIRTVFIIVSLAFIVLWAGYGFEISQPAGMKIAIPAGVHWEIYQSLTEHYQLGHPTFAFGRISTQGWWWYFPLAFLFKTPLPTVIVCMLGLVYGILDLIRKPIGQNRFNPNNLMVLLGWTLIYAASSVFSSVNIGYRHLLPILPCLFIVAGYALSKVWMNSELVTSTSRNSTKPIIISILSILMAWLLLGALKTSAAPLEFFNELAGGKSGGYRYLVDSNVDWGQNLWDLHRWMEDGQIEQVRYAHYSPASPVQYGVDAAFLPPDPRAISFTPWHPDPGIYVIGATVLQGAYTPDINTYAYFRTKTPIARLGGALFIYNVENRAKPSWVVSCAPEPAPDRIQLELSSPGLRILHPDCRSTQVFPLQDGPGLYIAPTGTPPPQLAQHIFDLKNSDGSVWRAIYRMDSPPIPQNSSTNTPELDGPLHYLGFSLDKETIEPGSELILETHWQVMSIPDRPLSLLAQLVAPGGPALAVGDGMGFPIEQWSVDDIIVQTHRLTVPDTLQDNQPLTVITGGYWLDTMERWSTGHNDNVIVLRESVVSK